MSDTKISAMTAASALSGPELFAGVQGGANVKITATQIQTFIGSGITIGSTVITSGTTTRFLYDLAGVVQETVGLTWDSTNQCLTLASIVNPAASLLTLTGGSLNGTTSYPVISATQTWNNSGLTATGLLVAITDTSSNNASKIFDFTRGGTSIFALTKLGALTIGDATQTSASLQFLTTGTDPSITGSTNNIALSPSPGGSNFNVNHVAGVIIPSGNTYGWSSSSSGGTTADTTLGRGGAAATILLGAADAATAVAQTLKVQSVVAGTADIAGANWTLKGSISTGTGVPGDIIFQTAGKGAASTVQNTLITALTIKGGTTNNTNVGYPSVVVGNAALATTATDGFLYIAGGAGAPAGTPTAFTGRVPLYWDSTAKQLYVYDGGAWLQPKTPAAAAIVSWQ